MDVYTICQEDDGASLAFYLGTQCYKKIAVDSALVKRGEFADSYAAALKTSDFRTRIKAVYLMAQNMYGVDYLTLPNVKKSRHEDLLRTELKSRHKNFNEMIFNSFPVHSDKVSARYCILMTRRNLLESIKSVFSDYNVEITAFVPSGIAAAEGAALLIPNVKKSPCLILLADEKESFIIEYNRETLLGDRTLPYGTNALSSEKVIPERLLYRPYSAQLLVINAKERAKATKLTMAINIEEEHIEDSKTPDEQTKNDSVLAEAALSDSVGETTEKAQETEENEAKAFTISNIAAVKKDSAEKTEEDDYYDDEAEISEQPEQKSVKTFTKSAVRVLPKFMRRPTPETPRGFTLENFRLFEKNLLMMAREMKFGENAIEFSNIYLYMPDEYSYIAEEMEKANPEFKWFNLNDEKYGDINNINRLMLEGVKAKFLKIKSSSSSLFKKSKKSKSQKNTNEKTGEGELNTLLYFKV